MIQVIKYNNRNNVSDNNIVFNDFCSYESFDLYDINIISLNDSNIWHSHSSQISNIDSKNDLCKIIKSIKTCKKSKVLVLFPKNYTFYYNYSNYSKKYEDHTEIKTICDIIQKMMALYVHPSFPKFEYEKGSYKSKNVMFSFDFYFEDISDEDALIKADKSDKVIAVKYDNVIISSILIDFNNDYNDELKELLNKLFDIEDEFYPEWASEIKFYNDVNLLELNTELEKKISLLEEKIHNNNIELEKNKYYKSVLYQSGDSLQKTVVDIIEIIMNKHFDFKDISEEDYLFKDHNYTFIVETKGLTHEVRGENVSAAFSHMTIYEDKLEDQRINENTKCLFIVASERINKPSERKKVNERQIKLAKNNNTLIIDTPSLLDIFEDFLQKKISKDEIIDLFINQSGLISYKKRGTKC